MVAKTQPKAMQLVLAYEGGFVDHPKDPGGPTNKGVTQRVYDAYRTNKGLETRSVREITDAELTDIYDKQYWDAVKADQLPAGIDFAVFDYAVNSGAARAIKDLQRALNDNANFYGIGGQVAVDGIAGQGLIAACNQAASIDECDLIDRYCDRRMMFLKSLRTWATFGKGWERRVIGVKEYATQIAKNDLQYPIAKANLPSPIGFMSGEESAKGLEQDQAALKTKTGIGSALAAAGAGGQTLIASADTIRWHIDDTTIGKLALAGFIVLLIVGVALVAYDWYRKQQEKAVS